MRSSASGRHSDDGAFGPGLQAFGPAQAPTRLALTAAIFANQNPDKPQFILVFTNDCGRGNVKVTYLRPLVPPASTVVIPFPSPLVIGARPGDAGFCLWVETPDDGALYPYTLVGYVL